MAMCLRLRTPIERAPRVLVPPMKNESPSSLYVHVYLLQHKGGLKELPKGCLKYR